MTTTKPIEVEANAEKGAVVLWLPVDAGLRDFVMDVAVARELAKQINAACDKLQPEVVASDLAAHRSVAIRDISLFESQLARTPQDIFPDRHAEIMRRLQASRAARVECDLALDKIER